VLVADFGSRQPPHLHARFPYPPSLLADFLALRGGEIGEKLVEIRVSTVFPMKLDRTAQHHSRRLHLARFEFGGKQHVQ